MLGYKVNISFLSIFALLDSVHQRTPTGKTQASKNKQQQKRRRFQGIQVEPHHRKAGWLGRAEQRLPVVCVQSCMLSFKNSSSLYPCNVCYATHTHTHKYLADINSLTLAVNGLICTVMVPHHYFFFHEFIYVSLGRRVRFTHSSANPRPPPPACPSRPPRRAGSGSAMPTASATGLSEHVNIAICREPHASVSA